MTALCGVAPLVWSGALVLTGFVLIGFIAWLDGRR